jgi:hypothetical protein
LEGEVPRLGFRSERAIFVGRREVEGQRLVGSGPRDGLPLLLVGEAVEQLGGRWQPDGDAALSAPNAAPLAALEVQQPVVSREIKQFALPARQRRSNADTRLLRPVLRCFLHSSSRSCPVWYLECDTA